MRMKQQLWFHSPAVVDEEDGAWRSPSPPLRCYHEDDPDWIYMSSEMEEP
jgi:hypothetical protein